jgi:hypothetical protein
MKPRGDAPEDDDAPSVESLFRPLDLRRIREIRKWLEGSRPDAPTLAELRDFVTWVSGEIEFALARHQPTRDLLVLLNAARGEIHAAEGGGAAEG